jgi:hypothetical protein
MLLDIRMILNHILFVVRNSYKIKLTTQKSKTTNIYISIIFLTFIISTFKSSAAIQHHDWLIDCRFT